MTQKTIAEFSNSVDQDKIAHEEQSYLDQHYVPSILLIFNMIKTEENFLLKFCKICSLLFLKGYCTIFKHVLKSLEITDIVLSKRMSKTARKNSKGLKSYKEFKF